MVEAFHPWSSACAAAVLRLCLQPPAADWHKDTAKGLLPGCLASVVAPVAMAVGPVTVIVASISIRVMMTLIVVDEVGRAFRHDRRYCSWHHRSGRGLGGHPLEHSGQTQSCYQTKAHKLSPAGKMARRVYSAVAQRLLPIPRYDQFSSFSSILAFQPIRLLRYSRVTLDVETQLPRGRCHQPLRLSLSETCWRL